MPRRKISLEQAFAVFEKHGLQVEVTAVQQPEAVPHDDAADFVVQRLDSSVPYGLPRKLGPMLMKITLHTKQTMASGGSMTPGPDGASVTGQGIQMYGPGVCYVPTALAGHLLYQDQLALEADRRMLDTTHRQYLVVPRRGPGGMVNVGIEVDDLNLNATRLSDMYFA